jgi:hypothetical protein
MTAYTGYELLNASVDQMSGNVGAHPISRSMIYPGKSALPAMSIATPKHTSIGVNRLRVGDNTVVLVYHFTTFDLMTFRP